MKAMNIIGILLLYIAVSAGVAMACNVGMSPCAGPAETTVNLVGSGYHISASHTINIKFDNVLQITTPAICITGTGVNAGKFSCSFKVPIGSSVGNHNVKVEEVGHSSYDKTIIFKVISPIIITWANPDDISAGTALSGTQLNAAASVAGSFKYTPAAGVKLNAGANQILHVEFTPTSNSCYHVTKDVTINVVETPVCGNGHTESGEQCDDQNTINFDGCSATCQTETPQCGNGHRESGEQCDDQNTNSFDGCSASCQTETPQCGNGHRESGEQCDDGDIDSGDGCSAICQNEQNNVPEFPTIALPMIAVIGLMFLFQRRMGK